MRKNRFAYALALAPLLLGADSAQYQLLVKSFPVCGDNEFLLGVTGGVPRCGELPKGTPLQLPDCTGKLLTSRLAGDVNTLQCTNKGTSVGAVNITDLTNLESKVTMAGTLVTNLKNNPPAARRVYVGVTAATGANAGKFVASGFQDGLNAGNALCNAAHAGSSMCTAFDLYNSVVAGKLKEATASIPRSWIWFANMKERNTTGANVTPTDGVVGTADNCGSHTYPTGDRNWFGMTAEWTTLANNARGFKFYHTACSAQTYPIACCK